MLEVSVLGCGSSLGVPVLSCKCLVCKSDSPYNKRLRSSIIITQNETKILVDFGFNIKEQLTNADISNLDGAILTHDHADHISGIDELRVFFYVCGKPLDIFVLDSIAPVILDRYSYLFDTGKLVMNVINGFEEIKIKDIELQVFPQIHGPIKSLGIRVDGFVYSCDVNEFPAEADKYLYEIDRWVVDCMDYKSNFAHAGLEKVLEWDEKYKPRKIYLTNMNHNIDYHKIITELPSHIIPLYDGCKIKL
ncbi:MAG: MBL fold metallo-hydrolase [Rickettsiaceae bacterium]